MHVFVRLYKHMQRPLTSFSFMSLPCSAARRAFSSAAMAFICASVTEGSRKCAKLIVTHTGTRTHTHTGTQACSLFSSGQYLLDLHGVEVAAADVKLVVSHA
jgi:hypothetical protein